MNYLQSTIGLLLAALPVFGIAQTTADLVKMHDTRDISETPDDINKIVRFDFKRRTTVGVPGTGSYSGQLTIAPWADNSGGRHHQLNFNDGGVFYRTGLPDDTSWGGWQKLLIENEEGNVGIGTAAPTDKLSVNGRIRAKEVKVETANWPDYVFYKDYVLPSLPELETYIKNQGHLPGIPTAQKAETEGIDLGEMNKKLLEKVEELTLYLIRLDSENTELRQQMQSLSNEIKVIKSTIN